MKRSLIHLMLLVALWLPAFGLVPQPTSMTLDGGSLSYSSGTRIFYQTRTVSRTIESTLLPMAEVLAEELEITTGIKPAIIHNNGVNVPGAGDISLEFETVTGTFAVSEDQEDQSYTMAVSNKVVISSQYVKGVSYGTSTLIQSILESSGSYSIPKMTVNDVPASDYRGLMVDVARDPASLGTLKEVVRLARQYKIRYLHIHFTDDQHFTFPFTAVTNNLSNNFVYPRSDLQALNAYADARGVTIIPELEMPGHSGRMRASGYLSPGVNATESDAAAPANYAKLQAIMDDMLSVFTNSPYFHIGGDESSAGDALIPLVEAMNNHLRGKPAGQKKRLMVWEAFHGAPTTQIPATGDDRVIVFAWELSYNTPWNLLNNGYQLINASWKPMYVVGAGATNRMAHSQQLMWSPEEIFAWDKNTFSHFLPGMPVFEDVGPSDPVIGDGKWNAGYIGKEDQVIGGQLISWEQNDKVLIRDLQDRLPPAADRMWNPNPSETFATYTTRYQAVKERMMSIVQPIEILPLSATPDAPYTADYRYYSGSNLQITLRNRTKIPGTIRYNLGTFNNSRDNTNFDAIAETTGSSTAYTAPFTSPNGGFGIRARLHRSGGTPVEGHTIAHFNNWANNIKVTEYEVPRHPLPMAPDFASYTSSKIERTFSQPLFRGPYVTDATKGQMFRATLQAPGSGTYTMRVETGGGFATMYVDKNRNGIWEPSERVFTNFNGAATNFTVTLDSSPYQFRVDHATNGLSSLLMMSMNGPGTGGAKDIATYLTPPVEPTTPAVPLLLEPGNNLAGLPSAVTFSWSSDRADSYRLFVWPKNSTKPVVPTVSNLDTNSYRLTGLLPGIKYRWSVVAQNSNGSVESEVREFSTFDTSNLRAIGWNYDAGGGILNDTLAAPAVAGVSPFAQANWNNHSSPGQGVGAVPRSLVDNTGASTTAQVTAWTVSSGNSWYYGYSGSDPNAILLNAFNGKQASLTFSNIPTDYQEFGYIVVVYYGNNEGPSSSVLTVDGSVDDLRTRTIRTGNTAQAAYQNVGFVEGDDTSGNVSNCSVFSGLNDPSFTVSLTNDNNNGISAVQIIRIGPPPGDEEEEEVPAGLIGWNFDNGVASNDTLSPLETAGAPGFQQSNWNNHAGSGQSVGTTPFALNDHTGAASGVEVTAWSLASGHSWFYGYTGNDPNGKLMESFTTKTPSITFSGIPSSYSAGDGYSVVVYYGNNEGPSNSTLTLTGSSDDTRSRTIRTGNTAASAWANVGFVEGTDVSTGSTNFTVFTGLNDPGFTVAIGGSTNNGICAVQIVKAGSLPGDLIEPGPVTTYEPFYPGEWEAGEVSTDYYPWTGDEITFMTMTDDLDVETMTTFIGLLDGGWKLYRDLTGRSPSVGQRINGNPVIAAIPYDAYTCGIGCGFLGHEGIETTGFYTVHYPDLLIDPTAVAHLYFYEMGRNYYTFGAKHENFITGFAVFMRYVCIDTLGVNDIEPSEREKIDDAIDTYVASGTHTFLETFTNGYGLTEKMERIPGADQPVMYASAMLKLWKLLGDEWLAEFYNQLMTCPDGSIATQEGARSNALSWFVAASRAAEQDLSPIFVTQWRMILTTEEQAVLASVDWDDPGVDAGDIIQAMQFAAKPTALAPAHSAINVHPRQALHWSYNGATSYDVYLWADGGSKPGTPTASGLANKFYEPSVLANGTTYHWSVVAHHPLGTTESNTFSFTTILTPVAYSSVGWNFDYSAAGSDTVGAGEYAGVPEFSQQNWNNHVGVGQNVGSVPLSLVDNTGASSGIQLTAWTLSDPNSWYQSYSGSDPNAKLMNSFTNKQPSLTFSGIPSDYRANGYMVVVYYGNNEGPASSVITLTGSVDDSRTRTITTGNGALSAYHNVGFVEGTSTSTGSSNYTVFTGLNDMNFTLAFSNANNNGICAVQIVKIPTPPLAGMIGWNYDMGYTPTTYDTVGPTEIAGAPGFEQDNWNNHTGAGQGTGTVPFSLHDSDGNSTGTQVTAWSLNTANSWTHGYAGSNADSKLMNSFSGMRPSLTFSNIPADYQTAGYSVVVYYGNNEGPSNSVLTLTGSVNDSKTRTIRTGTTALSGHHVVGYIEGTDTLGTPTNYTVFTGLDDASFTVSFANANNNGICAVQIVRVGSSNETEEDPPSGFSAWQETSPGAGTSATSDNDKDGWVDLVEYALGANPASGVTPPGAPRMDSSSGTADFLYSRPVGLTDVVYTLEGSVNCVDWHPISDIAPIVEVDGEWEHIRYKDIRSTTDVPGMAGSSSSFFRLSFKQP
jgi:hypothetical protein